MTGQNSQEEDSGYDQEWGLDDDDSGQNDVDAADDQQTSEGSTAPNDAPAQNGNTSPKQPDQNREDGEGGEDVWAGVPDAAKEAFRRAENARLAAENRAKVNADKLAERGREQKALRDKVAELEDASRPPTEFEKEFEGYGKDVSDIVERVLSKRLPPADPEDEKTPEQIEEEFFSTLTEAHPDAAEVYTSEGVQKLLAEDPSIKIGNRAVLFSEAVHSDDAATVIEALNHYKTINPNPAATSSEGDDPLAAIEQPGGSQTKQDMRTTGSRTAAEQYEAEWETDDI